MGLYRFTRTLVYITFIALIVMPLACDKPEGFGGTSSVYGSLVVSYYNNDYTVLLKEEPAVDEDVFIVFGENDYVGDKIETSNTGGFRFTYLRPGDYTLYYMGEDTTTLERNESAVSTSLTIESGKELNLGTLKRAVSLDFDDGSSSIRGHIRLVNYKNTSEFPFLEVKDTSNAQELEVYLVYNNHEFYDERIRTGSDGVFEFRDLIPGEYKVYAYSEDVTGATEDIPVEREVTITEFDQKMDVGTMIVEQL